jgi:hypothetical protein
MKPPLSTIVRGPDAVAVASTERADVPVGFMGLAEHEIAALFLEPVRRGQGGGRRAGS